MRNLFHRIARILMVCVGMSLFATAASANVVVANPIADSLTDQAVGPKRKHEIVFIDKSISNLDTQLAAYADGAEVILLGSGRDPLIEIANALRDKRNVTAVHIVSHSQSGRVSIAGHDYDKSSLESVYAAQLAEIGRALAPNGDILFYGCDLAADLNQRAILETFARLSHADVAASENPTGASSKGGDWSLEWASGRLETVAIAAPDWNGLLWTTEQYETAWWGDPATAPHPNPDPLPANSRFSAVSAMTAGSSAATFAVVLNRSATIQRLSQVDATTAPSGPSANEYFVASLTTKTANGAAINRITFNQVSANVANAMMQIWLYDPTTNTQIPVTNAFLIDGSTNTVAMPMASTLAGMAPNRTYQLRFYMWNCTATIAGAANACAIDNPVIYSMANQPPVAVNDSFNTPYQTAVTGNMTASDTDPESQSLTVDRINGATYTVGTPIALANGSLTITNRNGAFTFTPSNGFSGTQTFTYRINDGYGGISSTATITITVYGPLILAKTWTNSKAGHTASATTTGGSTSATFSATAPTNVTGSGVGIVPGTVITLPPETFDGGATQSMYTSTVACTGGTTLASGATGRTITFAASTTATTCTYTNARRTAQLQLRKTWVSANVGNAVTLPATTGFTTNTVALSSTANTTNETDSGAAVTVYAGDIGTIRAESFTNGSASAYVSELRCSGGTLSGTNALTNNTLTINGTDAGSTVLCTYTNTRLTTLTVTKTSSVTVDYVSASNPKSIPGAIVRYCILVTNPGVSSATNVVATDTLPTNMTYVPNSLASGTTCANATNDEDDDAAGADESDPFGVSISGTTVTGVTATLAASGAFAIAFNATIN